MSGNQSPKPSPFQLFTWWNCQGSSALPLLPEAIAALCLMLPSISEGP